MFQLSLSGDVHDLWVAVVDIIKPPPTTEPSGKETKLLSTSFVETSAPPLPIKSVSSPPLPRNKEVIMFLEKMDS